MLLSHQVVSASEPHEALPGLYISSVKGARDKGALDALGITHILTVAKALYPAFLGEYNYMLLDVQDWMGEDLLYYFEEAIKFIDEGRKEGNVLVHCQAGVSRSASVVIAYIMHAERVSFQVALDKLKKVRPIVHPNEAFKRQLEIFERWQGAVGGLGGEESGIVPRNSDAPAKQEGSETEAMWENAMCKLLFRLEFVAGFEKSGIRKVVAGEDPHLILNRKIYTQLTSTYDRPKPTYYKVERDLARSGELKNSRSFSNLSLSSPNSSPTTPREGLIEEAIEYKELEADDNEEFTLSLESSDFYESKIKNTRSPQDHTLWVWSCTKCGRYLFTPLNVTGVNAKYFFIECMEWMRELGEREGDVKCEKCNTVIGHYCWNENETGFGNKISVPIFEIRKDLVTKQVVVASV